MTTSSKSTVPKFRDIRTSVTTIDRQPSVNDAEPLFRWLSRRDIKRLSIAASPTAFYRPNHILRAFRPSRDIRRVGTASMRSACASWKVKRPSLTHARGEDLSIAGEKARRALCRYRAVVSARSIDSRDIARSFAGSATGQPPPFRRERPRRSVAFVAEKGDLV